MPKRKPSLAAMHNMHLGWAHNMQDKARKIIASPTSTDEAKHLAARIELDATRLIAAMQKRKDT